MIKPKPLPAPPDLKAVDRALISVFDKTDVVEFARRLAEMDVEILSTGGTARVLGEAGVKVTDVSAVTGFPEILGGRVKTLHPHVHGALLARGNDRDDLAELESLGIRPIDLVVVNLYPFSKVVSRPDVELTEAIENIDIGGPTMIRAAAKNHCFVGVVTSPDDYESVARAMETSDRCTSLRLRRDLARKAFAHTADYDGGVHRYLETVASGDTPASAATASGAEGNGAEGNGAEGSAPLSPGQRFRIDLPLAQPLRYGENPHQWACLYGRFAETFEQLHGKELSFNNLLDLAAAIGLIGEFGGYDPTVAILKHTNPCGVGTADTLSAAYDRAYATDRQSPFGGIVIANRMIDVEAANRIDAVFTEIVIAPDFSRDAYNILSNKLNRRLIKVHYDKKDTAPDVRSLLGGALVQERDPALPSPIDLRAACRVVTKREPTDVEWRDLDFAWRVVKHVKSNAIVYARDGATLGIGAGQMSRVDASEIAVAKSRKSSLSLEKSAVASDAFFPFADGLIAAADVGASSAIQPGGSRRDDEVIAAADEHGMAMVFTGRRHFRH